MQLGKGNVLFNEILGYLNNLLSILLTFSFILIL